MIFAMNKSPRRLDTYEEVDLLMKKEIFIKNIQAASKQIISDLVIKNITIVDVFQNSTFISDVAICGEYIVGIGEYTGKTEIDGTGCWWLRTNSIKCEFVIGSGTVFTSRNDVNLTDICVRPAMWISLE